MPGQALGQPEEVEKAQRISAFESDRRDSSMAVVSATRRSGQVFLARVARAARALGFCVPRPRWQVGAGDPKWPSAFDRAMKQSLEWPGCRETGEYSLPAFDLLGRTLLDCVAQFKGRS